MPSMPLVSVVTPAYNSEEYIERCLVSVAAQTYPNLEHLIINDGSTDRTEAIVRTFMAKHENVRCVTLDRNRGLSAARGVGLREARGEYIVWLDSDDEARPRLVEALYGALIKYNVPVALCNYENIRPGRESEKRYDTDCDLVFSCEELLRMVVRNALTQAIWANITPKAFYSDADFKEGQLFEDVANVYKVYLKAERAAVVKEPLLRRYFRRESLAHKYILSRRVEAQEMYIRRAEILERIYPGMEKAFYERCFGMLTTLRRYVIHSSPREFRLLKPRIKAITHACRKNGTALLPANAGFIMRLEFYLMSSGSYPAFLLSLPLHLPPLRHDLPAPGFEGTRIED